MIPYPWFPAGPFSKMVQRLVWKPRLATTSIGGLTNDEVREEARKDIRTLAARLSKINFIASESLTMYDFTVFAHISSILFWRTDNWLAPLFREKEIFYHYLAKVAEAVGGFDYELMEQYRTDASFIILNSYLAIRRSKIATMWRDSSRRSLEVNLFNPIGRCFHLVRVRSRFYLRYQQWASSSLISLFRRSRGKVGIDF